MEASAAGQGFGPTRLQLALARFAMLCSWELSFWKIRSSSGEHLPAQSHHSMRVSNRLQMLLPESFIMGCLVYSAARGGEGCASIPLLPLLSLDSYFYFRNNS